MLLCPAQIPFEDQGTHSLSYQECCLLKIHGWKPCETGLKQIIDSPRLQSGMWMRAQLLTWLSFIFWYWVAIELMLTRLCPKRFWCLFRTQQITLKWLLAPLLVKGIDSVWQSFPIATQHLLSSSCVREEAPDPLGMCSARSRTHITVSVLSITYWLLSDRCPNCP